ncbi:MAG: molybdopterin-dependent oxidoreductase [Anaerolineaceae bacterium]|nr:molybdopterin-dependent oxidoreductase [Anaerolineaceae bacterium]
MGNPEIIGKSAPIRDAVLKATGELKYVGDMKMPEMLVAKMLLSPHAHARIKSIDIEAAQNLPGVYAVVCHKNTPSRLFNSAVRFFEHESPETEQVFPETVRFAGDRVAAVAAEDEKIAEAALKLIKVEYEELPTVFDVEKALEEDAPILHKGGNKAGQIFTEAGNVDEAFKTCDRIYEDRYEMPPIHHLAIETHAVIADFDSRSKLTVWTPSQNTFNTRLLLSRIFKLPMNRVRVIRPTIGGAFGGKNEMTIEPVVAALAIQARRPVKLVLNRREAMIATRTRHAAVVYVKTGVMDDGRIVAQDFKVLTNAGAYCSGSINVLAAMSAKVFKIYKIADMRFKGHPVYTNIPSAGAMRGYGSPQVFNAQQAQFAKIARDLGMDFVEFQLKNVVDPDGVDQRFKKPLGNPRVKEAVERGAKVFQWEKRKKDNRPVEPGWKRGIGMAIGAHGSSLYGVHRDMTALSLKVNEDGTFVLYTGTHDMGNGSVTMQTRMIASVLGVRPEDIGCVETDTDLVPWNLGDYASRGVYVEGGAALKVARSMKEKMAEKASNFLDCMTDQVEFENGSVFVRNDPVRTMTLSELVVKTQTVDQEELLASESYAAPESPTSYGIHFAEVLVNEETGKIKVVDYTAVHDVGKVVNRLNLEGQLEGGIQMGLGYALSEEMRFNENGRLVNSNLKKYVSFHATDMPKIQIEFIEGFEPSGPYGAKSIGECATVPVAPAVMNAVCAALDTNLYTYPIKIVE